MSVNGKAVDSANEFTEQLSRLDDAMTEAKTPADSLKIRTVTISYLQKATGDTLSTGVVLSPELRLGVAFPSLEKLYPSTHVSYNFFESFPAGISYGWNVLKGYISDMQYVFSADGAKSLGGFGSIGSLFPAQWDWYLFWKMTAFLSIILAFMNILPIPALDGGTRAFPALRDDYGPQTIGAFHDCGRIYRYRIAHVAYDCGQPQRHSALVGLYVSHSENHSFKH